MTTLERRWAARTLDGLAPELDGTPRPSAIGADRFVADFVASQPSALQGVGLRVLLLLFVLLPVLVLGRPRRFFSLRMDLRERYFLWWYEHPIYVVRQLAIVMKTLLCLHWLGHPDVQRRLGCDKPNARPSI